MTLSQTRGVFWYELGLLERFTFSEDYQELNNYDQEKLVIRIQEIESTLRLLCSIRTKGTIFTPVLMYHPDTTYIRQFETLVEISYYLFGNKDRITDIQLNLDYIMQTCQGFIFRYKDACMGKIPREVYPNSKKAVEAWSVRVSKTGSYTLSHKHDDYDSITEAANFLGITKSSASQGISRSLEDHDVLYRGYAWRYQ